MAFLEDVKYLTKKYTGNPPPAEGTPYFTFLNAELEKHEKEFWDTLNKYNGVFDQWVRRSIYLIVSIRRL
jgi:hypothetical protein